MYNDYIATAYLPDIHELKTINCVDKQVPETAKNIIFDWFDRKWSWHDFTIVGLPQETATPIHLSPFTQFRAPLLQ